MATLTIPYAAKLLFQEVGYPPIRLQVYFAKNEARCS